MIRAASISMRSCIYRPYSSLLHSGYVHRGAAPSLLPTYLRGRQHIASAVQSPTSNAIKDVEQIVGPLSREPQVPPPVPRVIIISGPSGVGKDAVLKQLQEQRPDLYFVVTATSRAMRPGEVEGKDYFFVSKEQFEKWISTDQLLEHAIVYGEYKGIPRSQVDAALARGSDVVLRIDVQGAATVRKLMPNVVTIFLVADSEASLVTRLVSRKTEEKEKLLLRVATAREELRRLPEFDYVVVNRDGQLEQCVAQLGSIIEAERCKVR